MVVKLGQVGIVFVLSSILINSNNVVEACLFSTCLPGFHHDSGLVLGFFFETPPSLKQILRTVCVAGTWTMWRCTISSTHSVNSAVKRSNSPTPTKSVHASRMSYFMYLLADLAFSNSLLWPPRNVCLFELHTQCSLVTSTTAPYCCFPSCALPVSSCLA